MRSFFERTYNALATVACRTVARILLTLCICGVGGAGLVLALGTALLALSVAVFCGLVLYALYLFAGLLAFGIVLLAVSAIVFCGAILILE
jgi:hypothetical protein